MRTSVALVCSLLVFGQGTAFAAPPNDDRADAIDVGPYPFRHEVDTTGASDEIAEPENENCPSSGKTVWYRLRANSTMTVALSIHARFESRAIIWYERAPGVLEPKSCLRGIGVGSVTLQPDKTWYLQLGGVGGASGKAVVDADRAGSISGMVTNEKGRTKGSDWVVVEAFWLYPGRPAARVREACVGEDDVEGRFVLRDLLPGRYKIRYLHQCEDEGNSGPSRWYPDVASIECATEVIVRAGEETTGIDAVVPTEVWSDVDSDVPSATARRCTGKAAEPARDTSGTAGTRSSTARGSTPSSSGASTPTNDAGATAARDGVGGGNFGWLGLLVAAAAGAGSVAAFAIHRRRRRLYV